MTRMHNPAHPGAVLREYMDDLTITELAAHIHVSRATLQRIVSGTAGISVDMAYRLAAAFGTTPEFWANMQLQYDLYHASKGKRPKIECVLA